MTNINKKQIKKEIKDKLQKENKNNNKIITLSNEINQIKDNLDTIYLDKINKKLDENQYQRIKTKLEIKQKTKEENLKKLKREINISTINIDKYLKEEYLSRILIINLIDKIEISEEKTIDITFTFSKDS